MLALDEPITPIVARSVTPSSSRTVAADIPATPRDGRNRAGDREGAQARTGLPNDASASFS